MYNLLRIVPREIFHIRLKLESVCPSPVIQSPKCKMLCNYRASSCMIIPSDLHDSSFYSKKKKNYKTLKPLSQSKFCYLKQLCIEDVYPILHVYGRGSPVALLTSNVTGRQQPAQIKPEGVICLCSKNRWLKRVFENKRSVEGNSKNKRGKTSHNSTRQTGRTDWKGKKRKKQWPSFKWQRWILDEISPWETCLVHFSSEGFVNNAEANKSCDRGTNQPSNPGHTRSDAEQMLFFFLTLQSAM